MATALEFVIYTPVLQFFIAYVWLYRHDPGRITRGRKEKTGPKAWMPVLRELGLADTTQREADGIEDERPAMWGVVLVAVTVTFSALVPPIVNALLPSELARFTVALTIAAQFVPALTLLVGLSMLWLGDFPVRAGVYYLRKNRLGSRVRHLGTASSAGLSKSTPDRSTKQMQPRSQAQ